MTIEFIKEHAKNLTLFAEETNARLKEHPDNFWLQVAAKNQSDAALKVAREVALEESEEAGELIDLRFIGPKAEGSMMLDAFIQIAEPLSKAWKYAAYRILHGHDPSRTDSVIANALNLKLAGMAYGSTRILLTGNSKPDLTGESVLQATLMQTFALLTSRNEEFYDAVDAMGGKAAQQIAHSIKAIDHAGLSAQFSWKSPKSYMTWNGVSDEVTRIRVLLDSIQEPEEYSEKLKGYVAGISDTGRIEIRTPEGKVTVRYPLSLTEAVQHLTITKPAILSVRTARYLDAVAKKHVYKRQLLSIDDI